MTHVRSASDEINEILVRAQARASAVFGFPIDARALFNRCTGSLFFASSLLGEFEKTGGQYLADIRFGIANDDWHAVAEAAHTLKGASAIVEASELCRLAAAIESAGRAGDRDPLQSLYHELGNEMQRCLGFIAAFRDACGGVRQ